ncbi:MAG: SPOR domain-containing protein [Treponema sp.]|jgi:DedD protein|nr:SPOR domain-containing protein [Treponema sp.]
MEKKKLLMIAVSVGVFLVIVMSAAILVFRPGAGSAAAPAITSTSPPAVVNLPELAGDEAYQGLQDPPPAPLQENNKNNNYGAETSTVINVPKPSAPAVPAAKPAPAKPVPAKAVPETKPAPEAKPAVVAAPSATPPTASKTSSRDYWVQVGSFEHRERADGAKSTLDNKGLSAIITNQIVNSKMFYRVRVGPYNSQNEADYWLAMIKSIDGFQNSQIWESQTYR